MKIILIRHGECNYETDKLTWKGKLQVKWALDCLKDEKPQAIYCSPRTRTLQSANILNKKLNIPLHIFSELTDRQYLNSTERELYWEDFDKHYLDYSYENKNFETCKDFIDRCFKGFGRIVKENKPDSTIIICAHCSTLYALNAYLTGIPETKKITWIQCGNGSVIKFFI